MALVDRDNVDQVMKRLDVRLELPGVGVLRFQELEDFHPDRLFQSLDLFRGMRDLSQDCGFFRFSSANLEFHAASQSNIALADARASDTSRIGCQKPDH